MVCSLEIFFWRFSENPRESQDSMCSGRYAFHYATGGWIWPFTCTKLSRIKCMKP